MRRVRVTCHSSPPVPQSPWSNHDIIATGTAEPGGWTTREFLTILDGLVGLKIVGADVVEVAPAYDNPGETTVLAASEIVQSLLDLMVETPVEEFGTL